MSILTHDPVTSTIDPDAADYVICGYDCDHPACIHALADLWASATAPLTPPF